VKRERLDINVLRQVQQNLESLAKLEIKEMLQKLDEETDSAENPKQKDD
jgi:hypothetical protein